MCRMWTLFLRAHIDKQDTKLIEVENMYRTVEQPYVDALKKMQDQLNELIAERDEIRKAQEEQDHKDHQ